MLDEPKNLIQATEALDIEAAVAILKVQPDAWRDANDGMTLVSILITHLRKNPKPKKLHKFIKSLLYFIPDNDIDVFITCAAVQTTLLHEAVQLNNIRLINLLLSRGADPFIACPGDQRTAFFLAVENNAIEALITLARYLRLSPLEDERMLAVLTDALQINKPACFWSIVLGYCNILKPDIALDLASGKSTLLQLEVSTHPSFRKIYFMMIEAALRFNLTDSAHNLIEGAMKTMDADDKSEILTVVLDHGHLDLATWLLDIDVQPEIAEGNTEPPYSPTLEAAARTGNKALIERLIGYPQITPGIVLNTVVDCTPTLCGSEEGQVIFLDLLYHGNPSGLELITITRIVIEADCNKLLKELIVRGLDFNIDFRHHNPMKKPKQFLLARALLPYGNGKIEGRFDCALTLIANGYLSCRNSGLLLAGLLRYMAVVEEQPDLPLIEFLAGFGASPILLIDEYIRLCKKKGEDEDENAGEDEVSDAILTAYRTALTHVFTCNIAYLHFVLTLEPAILVHEARAMIALSYYPEEDLKKCINISGNFPELVLPAQALLDLLMQVKEKAEDTSRVPSLFEQTYLAILNAGEENPALIARLEQLTEQLSISPEICQRIVDIREGHIFTLPRIIARRLMGG